MRPVYFSTSYWKLFSKSLLITGMATLGLLSGVVPQWSKDSHSLVFNPLVYAQQAVSDAEVTKYARAVLAMEPLRQAAYNEIKKIISGTVPEIECHNPDSINGLPSSDARKIARNYCDQALALVQNYLEPSRFNTITTLAESDANLRQRIKNAIIREQSK